MDYWHRKNMMPIDAKDRIGKMVTSGEFVDILEPYGYKSIALLRVKGNIFKDVFAYNYQYLFRGDYLSPSSHNTYDDAECFLTEDGLAGFAITKDGWLISMFSNQPWRSFLDMIVPWTSRANKLVCKVADGETSLVDAYSKSLGFTPIAYTKDATIVMLEYYGEVFTNDFVRAWGRPSHVFMCRLKEESIAVMPIFDDFFEAERYVNEVVV